MAGIYIHIPFCRKACYYCNFHFSTTLSYTDEFFTALLQEITLQKDYLAGQTVHTLYFGGGTPSLATEQQLALVLERLNRHFVINSGAEITLEANPDDIQPEQLAAWKKLGINRLSIGIQSFRDEDLVWMNRVHHSNQAEKAIERAQEAGFSNLTIDLIYGVPGMNPEAWRQNIARAIALNIPHLSCYALTVEPGTALDKMIEKNKKENADAALAAEHFDILVAETTAAGYEQYEISNFSLPGHRSRHNSSYWQGLHYLGLGPSAHSYNGFSRQWNVANNRKYINALQENIVPFEQEILTPAQQLNEYIMTALRTLEGINLQWLQQHFGSEQHQRVWQQAQSFIQLGKITHTEDHLRLTPAGRFFADGIAADLFAD